MRKILKLGLLVAAATIAPVTTADIVKVTGRDSQVHRTPHRLGRRRYEVAPGKHSHQLPGQVTWLITNSAIQNTTQCRNAGIIDNNWVVLNGSSSLRKADAPKLFKLWGYAYGGSGQIFTVPDLRDCWIMGYGNVYASGAMVGVAFGTDRTSRAQSVHGHGNSLGTNSPALSFGGRNNCPAGGTQPVIGNIDGSQSGPWTHGHNITGSVSDNSGFNPPAIGAVPVCYIQ